jgi:transposase
MPFRKNFLHPQKRSANTALAHKLARMVYFMMTCGEAFVDQRQQRYEALQLQRSVAALKRRAKDRGFVISPVTTTA